MDKQSSRFLLRACRPNGADAADPTFRDALENARLDPELGSWFAREQAIDRAIADRLREVRAPAGLRQQILDGASVSRRPRLSRPVATAIAAIAAVISIAFAIYTALPRRRPAAAWDTIVATAVSESRRGTEVQHRSRSAAELRAWFTAGSAPVPGELPAALAALPTIGGSVLTWEQVTVSRVSFQAPQLAAGAPGEPGENTVHLFTISRHSCSDEAVPRHPVIATRGDQAVATWRDARMLYVVVARAPAEALRELLGPAATIARGGPRDAGGGGAGLANADRRAGAIRRARFDV